MKRTLLVLGGARSGKSSYAEAAVLATGLDPVYVATAEAGDQEMAERIAEHRRRRGGAWRTVDAPLDLLAALSQDAMKGRAVLVDCLTLWLANLLHAGIDPEPAGEDLAKFLAGVRSPLALVSNEVGFGIVPDNALARRFRDAQGRLNQKIAAAVDEAVLVVAGLPLTLKAPTPEGRP